MKRFRELLVILAVGTAALGHTTIHTQSEKEGGVELKIMHLYPPEGNKLMGLKMGGEDTPKVKALQSVSLIHKGERTDLSHKVETFTLSNDSSKAPELRVAADRTLLKGGGDFIFVSTHIPHHKPNDIYIQLVTKSFHSKGNFLTDWPNRVLDSMPEILPLVNPARIYAGDLFRAKAVDEKGEPIPSAKILIEYLNREILNDSLGSEESVPMERAELLIFADDRGVFSYIPHAKGVWSFKLVDGDSGLKINGKDHVFNSLITVEVK